MLLVSGSFVAFFASMSAFSFPYIFMCAGTQQSSMRPGLLIIFRRISWIQGWVDLWFLIAIRALLESLKITDSSVGCKSMALFMAYMLMH